MNQNMKVLVYNVFEYLDFLKMLRQVSYFYVLKKNLKFFEETKFKISI